MLFSSQQREALKNLPSDELFSIVKHYPRSRRVSLAFDVLMERSRAVRKETDNKLQALALALRKFTKAVHPQDELPEQAQVMEEFFEIRTTGAEDKIHALVQTLIELSALTRDGLLSLREQQLISPEEFNLASIQLRRKERERQENT
jgi:hypothetical protein